MLLKFFPFVIKKIKWFRNFFNSLNIISGINRFLKIMRNCCPLKKKAQNKQLYLNIYDIYFDIVQQLLKKNIRLSIPFFLQKILLCYFVKFIDFVFVMTTNSVYNRNMFFKILCLPSHYKKRRPVFYCKLTK